MVLCWWLEFASKAIPRSMEAIINCLFTHPESLGKLTIAETVEILERQDFSVSDGKSLKGCLDHFATFLGQ